MLAVLLPILEGNSKAPVSVAFRPQPAGLFAAFCGSKRAEAGNGAGLGFRAGFGGKVGVAGRKNKLFIFIAYSVWHIYHTQKIKFRSLL